MNFYTVVLNTKQNQVINGLWLGNKVLAVRCGNANISSNSDGTFQLNHNAGLNNYVIFARFGLATQDFITFGSVYDPNAAYGVVHSSNGTPKSIESAVFWLAIGYLN